MEYFKIELQNITKTYKSGKDEIPAIKNISLEILPGEILGLLGPNGAGKTTLLKIIATILKPTSGEILIDNSRLNSLTGSNLVNFKRHIGYLPEVPYMYNNLSCEEYLTFIGGIYGMSKKQLKKQIDYFLKIMDLEEATNKLLKACSQGMLKKISLIAALINNQSILILDEPTNSLDPQSISTLKQLLVQYKTEGRMILLSTHILDIAEKISDRIAIIDKGRLKLVENIAVLNSIDNKVGRTKLEELFLEITTHK